jgi:cytochrome c oxidase subunit 1
MIALPAAWLFGAAVIAVLNAPTVASDLGTSGTYYVVAHVHYGISLAITFAIIAFVYLLLDFVFKLRYRRALGWGHFGLMATGTLLISAPSLFLRSTGTPVRTLDPQREFATLNMISSAGYGLTLLSVILFLALLVDAFVGRRNP